VSYLSGATLNSPAPGENLIEVQALGGLGLDLTHAGKRRDNGKTFFFKFFGALGNSG
jgi:hypothetical protein